MSRNDLRVVLELEKKSSGQENAMFYRYGMGDFQFWFSQDIKTGNIYSLNLRERRNVEHSLEGNFEMFVRTNEDEYGGYYPNEFEVRPKSRPMNTGDARKFMADMERACDVLDQIESFFQNSMHYDLYAKRHGIATEEIDLPIEEEGYGDYPTLEEIRRDYRELMGIIGDVGTVEQAKQVAAEHQLIVEINGLPIDEFENGMQTISGRSPVRGTNEDIEWIRYQEYGCLAYVYNYLDGKPVFDVWSQALDCEFLREITIDELTEENYKEWISLVKLPTQETRDDLSRVGNEMISKSALEEDVFAHLARMGLRWDSLDENWKNAWETVMKFESENGDFVSRERLMDVVLGQFGCDGAYLGTEYQLLQEAVAMAPAAPSDNVDGLLANALQRCSKGNEANALLQGSRDISAPSAANAVALRNSPAGLVGSGYRDGMDK